MTKDGFVFLVMGFTGKKAARFKEAYIEEFNRMEAELHKQTENMFILGGPRTLVIHFDENGQIAYTEKAPEGSMVTTLGRFTSYAEKNGFLVIHRDDLKTMTLEQLMLGDPQTAISVR